MSDEAYGRETVPGPEPGDGDSQVDHGGTELIDEEAPPTGTLFFMMILLILMVGLWVTVYWLLLSR